MISKKEKLIGLRINLLLAIAGGLLTFWALARLPSEEQSAIFLGFSASRLLVLGCIILSIIVFILAIFTSFKSKFWESQVGALINSLFERKRTFLFLFFLIGLSYLFLFVPDQVLGRWTSYRLSLYPVGLWFTVLVFQASISLFVLLVIHSTEIRRHSGILQTSLLVLGLLGLFVLFIRLSHIGLTPDKIYWDNPGAPILGYQVLTAWLCGIIFFLLIGAIRCSNMLLKHRFFGAFRLDLLLSAVLWGCATLLWVSQSFHPSYNTLEPEAPNFQYYPFGDAMRYDVVAQNFSIGIPIPSDFWKKPFYSFFLSGLHSLAGQDFQTLVIFQIMVLAFNPVLIYLLTRTLSNKPAGLIAALLSIFRERNGIALTNIIEISNSRLFLSDGFAMELMILLTLLVVIWLKNPGKHRVMPVVAGGVLGILTLTRGHPILLLPFILIAVIIVFYHHRHAFLWWRGVLLVLVGLSVSLLPWLWRNYQWYGTVSMQDTKSLSSSQLAALYSQNPLDSGYLPARLNGENDTDYYARIQKQPFEFIVQYPEVVARFVSSHYFHNLIFSYIYLPHSLQIENSRAYVKHLPFWKNWQGVLPGDAKLFLVFNLCVLALGISVVWKRSKMIALFPLLLGSGYNLSVSVSRLSGWRFIMPSDWITLLFYSAGLMELAVIVIGVYYPNVTSARSDQVLRPSIYNVHLLLPLQWNKVFAVCLFFTVLTLGLTTGQNFAPITYPEKDTSQILRDYETKMRKLKSPLPVNFLEQFLSQENAVALYGRGLYPMFLRADDGRLNYFRLAFAPLPYDRLVFQLIGSREIGVVLPLKISPTTFPDAANVLLFGCDTGKGYVDALLVMVETQQPVIYVRSNISELYCPFPEASDH